MWIGALLRRVHAEGGFGAVLHRGDDTAGSVVVVHRGAGGEQRALTRVAGPQGSSWRVGASGNSVDPWVARQRSYDPDLWIVELDVPDIARFIDETTV